jgi:chloramphenicol-sensitive protein RarD
LGVFLYKEPFDRAHLIGFSIVWVALAIFLVENYLAHRMPVEPVAELGEG